MIRASEVGEYLFCARAWWLRRVVGVRTGEGQAQHLYAGTLRHARHSQSVARSSALLWLATLLLLLGGLLLLVGAAQRHFLAL
ncbi:hypothetical protein [Candidatus Oscillochloris fontis]|uniref:hypothetical protein n=1 Tax=Candidatus Oscillochloris fontis TaxID=2496868 RepID=UPI00101DDC02|nr:hypothetical protein [Candidatus Oscillochloris fontis]